MSAVDGIFDLEDFSRISEILDIIDEICNSYDDKGSLSKKEIRRFHAKGKTFFQRIAKELNIKRNVFEISSKFEEDRDVGSILLKCDDICVRLSPKVVGWPLSFWSCSQRKDESDPHVHWVPLPDVVELHYFVQMLEKCILYPVPTKLLEKCVDGESCEHSKRDLKSIFNIIDIDSRPKK